MAIKKNDCILLLTELQEKGKEVTTYLQRVLTSPNIPLDVLKYINDNRQLDVAQFYEKIRANYNKKRSDLYINIVKEIEEPQEILTTLSAMLTQILLYSKKVENKHLFLAHARASEITKVLNNYFETFNITNAQNLLRLIKADIKALESIK